MKFIACCLQIFSNCSLNQRTEYCFRVLFLCREVYIRLLYPIHTLGFVLILNILFWKTDPFWFALKILIDLQSLVNIFYKYKMTLHVITYTTRPIHSLVGHSFPCCLHGQSRRFLAWSTFWHISFDEEDPQRQTLDYRYSSFTQRLPRFNIIHTGECIFRISRCLISI